MWPTHILEDSPLYPKSTNLNVNLIQKNTLIETSRTMFEHISGHCGLIESMHKINHHSNHVVGTSLIARAKRSFTLMLW